jgi:hypothetical protein
VRPNKDRNSEIWGEKSGGFGLDPGLAGLPIRQLGWEGPIFTEHRNAMSISRPWSIRPPARSGSFLGLLTSMTVDPKCWREL